MAFRLTDRGLREAEKINEPRDLDTQVLAFMYSAGSGRNKTVEVEEVMDRTHMGDEKTIRVMTRLERTGFVEEVKE